MAVTSSHIAANAITADKIQAGQITTDKISTAGISADVIKTGTLHADRIQAGSIVADKIAASSLNATKFKAAWAVMKVNDQGVTFDLGAYGFSGASRTYINAISQYGLQITYTRTTWSGSTPVLIATPYFASGYGAPLVLTQIGSGATGVFLCGLWSPYNSSWVDPSSTLTRAWTIFVLDA